MRKIVFSFLLLYSAFVSALPLFYVDSGGNGDPILLIHGFGASSYSWRNLVPALSENHRVITVDLKGFGRSPKPDDDAYTPLDQAKLVYELIEKLDLHHLTLVGHSYGGGVTLLEYFHMHDLGEARIKRLILIDAAAYPQKLPGFLQLLRFPFIGPTALKLLPSEMQSRNLLEKCYHVNSRIPDASVAEYAKPINSVAGRRALIRVAKHIIPRDVYNLVERYPKIDVPTLIVWGEFDEIIPIEYGRRLARDIPDAHFEMIPDCGHNPQEESPKNTLDVIHDFLAHTT